MAKDITSREQDYSQWYNDLVYKSGLADQSAVRGCMVIKPLGYALWENMKAILDREFKDSGHVNAYFPLFVPKSLFEAEEKNAEGFAKECAVVTHYRLINDPKVKGKLIVDPDARLEEELIVRPTSEAVIWNTYRDWIQSYRDLPILINQWANVVRWEMRTRPFLRTTEFLWQEGHTAHATANEAIEEAERMHDIYAKFAEEVMAIPVIKGTKSENERFAGALETYTIEAMMQDGKALQAGTSHFLGQNFAKAFEVKYLSDKNIEEYVWATSWGVSTRLIGALVMTHSDDDGLVLPPKLAPTQVIIIPIPKPSEELDKVAFDLMDKLKEKGIRCQYDQDDKNRPGYKFAEHELKGVPIRIGIGARDLEMGLIEMARRDTKEKINIPVESASQLIEKTLADIQSNLFEQAKAFREKNTHFVDNWKEFTDIIEHKAGFVYAHWDGSAETEAKIKELTKATIRCIPLGDPGETGKCIYTGNPSPRRVLFAKAY